jgi:hypothetical protein
MWAGMFSWGELQKYKSVEIIMTELQIPRIRIYRKIKKMKTIYWQGQLWQDLYLILYLIAAIYSHIVNLTMLPVAYTTHNLEW